MPGLEELMKELQAKMADNMNRAVATDDKVYFEKINKLPDALKEGDPLKLMGVVGEILNHEFKSKPPEWGV